MRIPIMVFGVIALTCLQSANSLACDCVTGSPEQSFKRADTVFVGTVASVYIDGTTAHYALEVKKSLKGPRSETIVVLNGLSNCSFTFFRDHTYLVYAETHDDAASVGSCSGTQDITAEQVAHPISFGFRADSVSEMRSHYWYIGWITVSCVLLSLSVGLFVTAVRKYLVGMDR